MSASWWKSAFMHTYIHTCVQTYNTHTCNISHPRPHTHACTHTLDTLTHTQVHLQTQQEVQRRFLGMAVHVVRNQGVRALYNGLTASLTRQVSYTGGVVQRQLHSLTSPGAGAAGLAVASMALDSHTCTLVTASLQCVAWYPGYPCFSTVEAWIRGYACTLVLRP